VLAGDAAHTTSPTGGHGLNTGIGDVSDLGWMLDALLRGWGGDQLLAADNTERRPDWRSTIDLFGDGFTLLRLGFAGDVTPLTAAAADRGLPLRVSAIDDPAIARLYERQLVLVRPDGMVAWRADSLPDNVPALVTTVSGWA
jgi:2-polyprenyl-6-methoxyphenol hydroxylase-like FAD-dependent oxidoreductase